MNHSPSNDDDITRRRLFMGAIGLGGATICAASFVRDKVQEVKIAGLGATAYIEHEGFSGLCSKGVKGVELALTQPGRYVAEVFDGADGRGSPRSLLRHEFEVAGGSHREKLPEMRPHVPVILHVTVLTEQNQLKTGLIMVGERE